MRILVVEDEPDLAGAIATGLRREGYAVDVAADGRSALERLPFTDYDVVCLDLNLPDMDGFDVCREIAEQRAGDAPPASRGSSMLTARGGVEDRIAGLDEGADDYLVKPFALGELLARMRALLRRESGATARGHPVAGPRARRRAAGGAQRQCRRRPEPEGVRAAALVPPPPERGAQRRAAARARLGRERRPVHQHRPGDDEQPAPQARGGRARPT